MAVARVDDVRVHAHLFAEFGKSTHDDHLGPATARDLQTVFELKPVSSPSPDAVEQNCELLAAEYGKVFGAGQVGDQHVSQAFAQPVEFRLPRTIFERRNGD